MLDKFIDCICDQDYSGMFLSETVPCETDIKEAWDKIYLQWCQLSQGESYNERLELEREINDLTSKINLVNACVLYLSISYSKTVIDILNEKALMCDVKVDDTGEVLTKKLNMIVSRAKRWEISLKEKLKQLEALPKSSGTITRDRFDEEIDALSNYKKYQVEPGKITVSLFYKGLNKMQREYEKQMNKLRVA